MNELKEEINSHIEYIENNASEKTKQKVQKEYKDTEEFSSENLDEEIEKLEKQNKKLKLYLTIVSFILLASFWIYHHEFIKIRSLNLLYLWANIFYLASLTFIPFTTSLIGNYSHFFLSNVIFGLNILLTIIFFLIMFYYAAKRGFLDEVAIKKDKKYVYHTLFIIMGFTVVINLLDFFINKNFIYLYLLVPVISTIRDVHYKLK